jgi:hypothetical protein
MEVQVLDGIWEGFAHRQMNTLNEVSMVSPLTGDKPSQIIFHRTDYQLKRDHYSLWCYKLIGQTNR